MFSSRIHTDWAVLVGQSHRLRDSDFRFQAYQLAADVCATFRDAIRLAVLELSASGYVFAQPETVFVPASEGATEWLRELESLGVHLPTILQAWAAEVGSVNLTGSHPDWAESGYVGLISGQQGSWLADPLVLEIDREWAFSQYDEWRDAVDEDGAQEVGPFRFTISPDHIHKGNVSGGLPYSVATDAPSVDALLLNARDCTSIFYHVTNALAWGGFPGFAHIGAPLPASVGALRRRLAPLVGFAAEQIAAADALPAPRAGRG